MNRYICLFLLFSINLFAVDNSDDERYYSYSDSEDSESEFYNIKKRVLVFGVGDKNSGNHWREFFGDDYEWESADINCEFKECRELNFNSSEQLNALPDDYYDIILFDKSTVKFMEWTYESFFIIKNKLTMDGVFYLPLEKKGGFIAGKELDKDFSSEESAEVWVKNTIIERQMEHLYSNQFYPTLDFLCYSNFFCSGEKYYSYEERTKELSTANNSALEQELNSIFLEIFKRLFGACEILDMGTPYFGPEETRNSVKSYMMMIKTIDNPILDNNLISQAQIEKFGTPKMTRFYDAFMLQVFSIIRKSPIFGAEKNGLVAFTKNKEID